MQLSVTQATSGDQGSAVHAVVGKSEMVKQCIAGTLVSLVLPIAGYGDGIWQDICLCDWFVFINLNVAAILAQKPGHAP